MTADGRTAGTSQTAAVHDVLGARPATVLAPCPSAASGQVLQEMRQGHPDVLNLKLWSGSAVLADDLAHIGCEPVTGGATLLFIQA